MIKRFKSLKFKNKYYDTNLGLDMKNNKEFFTFYNNIKKTVENCRLAIDAMKKLHLKSHHSKGFRGIYYGKNKAEFNEHNHHIGICCRILNHYFAYTAGVENMEKQVDF